MVRFGLDISLLRLFGLDISLLRLFGLDISLLRLFGLDISLLRLFGLDISLLRLFGLDISLLRLFDLDISLLRLFVLFVLIDLNAISRWQQIISIAVLRCKRAYRSNVVSCLEVCWHVLLICVGLSVSRLCFFRQICKISSIRKCLSISMSAYLCVTIVSTGHTLTKINMINSTASAVQVEANLLEQLSEYL